MINMLRKQKRIFQARRAIKKEFDRDYAKYVKWQYHNPSVHSRNALEAKILRQTHIIEKGMSLTSPKPKFGVQKALELLDYLDEYIAEDYNPSVSEPFINAIGVLNAYIVFHEERGFKPEEILERLKKWKNLLPDLKTGYGIETTTIEKISKSIHGEFPEFFRSRHAIRQFSEEPVSEEEIKKAVMLAMRAPSACNRQSCKVYYYRDYNINKGIGENIPGNTGFSDEVKNYLVVTSDISAFYDSFERNQVYVDGGIFTMALVEALHYHGIGSCILQNGETLDRDSSLRRICKNIPENEKIIVFLAIGHYKKEFSYALSHRKTLEDVLIIE